VVQKLSPGMLFGERIRSSRIGAFRLSERAYPPRLKTPTHSHKWPFFCLVLGGGYTDICHAARRLCKPSTLLCHPQGETHAEHFHEAGGRLFLAEIEPRWLKRNLNRKEIRPMPSGLYGGFVAGLAMRLYQEFLLGEGISPLIVEGLILEILGEALRHSEGLEAASIPKWLRQAREQLNARFAEPLTLREVAKTVRVHPVHLAQMFQKHYRCTVGAYIRRLRIGYASTELATSDTPLVDIALAAGFCDQSHFTRTFRRCTGMVPSLYRKSVR
jgi:AraC family transcriptional regulator